MLAKDLIAKIRKIEIRTRRLVEDLTGGAYHSVFKGRGIEFSEVREYTPDDDVRDIDWNVTARMGAPYIKKYAEERELTVIIALDASASLDFGSAGGAKREKAAETAALLALSAIRNHDKVGLLLFTDRAELWVPPRSGRSHVLRLIRDFLAFTPSSRKTNIPRAADALAKNLKKRAVVFVISDFLSPESFEKQLKMLNARHDVVAIRMLDPAEIEMPALSDLELEDSETGEIAEFDASRRHMLSLYGRAAKQELEHQNDVFARAKVDLVDMRTDEDMVKPLMTFFKSRKMRKG